MKGKLRTERKRKMSKRNYKGSQIGHTALTYPKDIPITLSHTDRQSGYLPDYKD